MSGSNARHDEGAMLHLCFHGIGVPAADSDPSEQAYWVKTDVFLRILDEIASRDDVAVSFDDGFSSDVEIAMPALLERGLRAGFFPVMGRTGSPGFLHDDQIRQLSGAGMHLGVHGWTHRVWRELGDSEFVDELERSRAALHELIDGPVYTAACPLGGYDRRVLKLLRRQGFQRVYNSDRALAVPDDWLQPRYSFHASDTVEDARRILDVRRSWVTRGLERSRMWAKRHR